jgi:hypothetical protein
MRGLRIPLLGCLVVMALAGASPATIRSGMNGIDARHRGKGPGYNKD